MIYLICTALPLPWLTPSYAEPSGILPARAPTTPRAQFPRLSFPRWNPTLKLACRPAWRWTPRVPLRRSPRHGLHRRCANLPCGEGRYQPSPNPGVIRSYFNNVMPISCQHSDGGTTRSTRGVDSHTTDRAPDTARRSARLRRRILETTAVHANVSSAVAILSVPLRKNSLTRSSRFVFSVPLQWPRFSTSSASLSTTARSSPPHT